MANEMAGESGAAMASRPARNFPVLVDAAARFLAVEDGPAVAVLDSNGWDTHANQGGAQGQLALRLAELDRGIVDLKTKLGAAWHNTVLMVVTEFGRTAAQNGTNGTDHGTAGVSFLAGGAVRGGQIVGDWPGLASGNLYQGRDLAPTKDLRSLFKTVLRDHLGLAGSAIDSAVFPSSGEAGYLRGLVS
jgi:uncharacterized protein (DUF1501 family)